MIKKSAHAAGRASAGLHIANADVERVMVAPGHESAQAMAHGGSAGSVSVHPSPNSETSALLLALQGASRGQPARAADVRKQLGMSPDAFDALLAKAAKKGLVCTLIVSKKRIETLMVWPAGAELQNPLSIHRKRANGRRRSVNQSQP